MQEEGHITATKIIKLQKAFEKKFALLFEQSFLVFKPLQNSKYTLYF